MIRFVLSKEKIKVLKKTTFVLFFAFLCNSDLINAQSLNCIWAQSSSSGHQDRANSIVTDGNGNVIVTGSFMGPDIVFGTNTLTTAGDDDIFIVKYSPAGTVLWANSIGGFLSESSNCVTTDVNGNIYITGVFQSPMIMVGSTTLINADNSGNSGDIFIIKYSPTGNLLWAKSAGGGLDDKGYSVSADANGNVFMTGEFQSSSITFGAISLTNISTFLDIFIVKYSTTGTVLWAKREGSNSSEWGTSVCTDASGNAFMVGAFTGFTVAFGTTTLTTVGGGDIFIVKYSPTGTVLWANSAGTSYFDFCSKVTTDATGNAIMTGDFGDNSITFGTTTLTSNGSSDMFIVKYSPSGNVLWANSAGSSDFDEGVGAVTDVNGNVFIVGNFWSPSFTVGTSTLINTDFGSTDVFIAKYSPTGAPLWASSFRGSYKDFGYDITMDVSENVLLSGYFSSPMLAIGTTTLTNAGGEDVFIAKLGGNLVDINENRTERTEINIYPNPFSSYITISFSEAQTRTTIKIVDILGNEIKTIQLFQEKKVVIEKGLMEAGIYFVEVLHENNQVLNKKIILL